VSSEDFARLRADRGGGGWALLAVAVALAAAVLGGGAVASWAGAL
jgi:hypothetical protein